MLILASSGPIVGGMERQAAQQAEELSKIPNTEVSIVAAECFENIISPSVFHYSLNMNKSRRNLFLLSALFRIIKKFSPDIIHAHGHKAASLVSSLKPFMNKDIKLIATAHGLKRSSRPLRKMDTIFTVSKGVAESVEPLKSEIVLNGIKFHQPGKYTKESFCIQLNIDHSLPLILGVGRLVETKRFERLVKASKDLNANVVICGDGPEMDKLKSIAPKNCLLIGYRDDIRDILFAADLMVIGTDRDGFSLALIEALQSGLPVLSTAVPGAEDLLPESSLIRNTEARAFHSFLKNHLANIEQLKLLQKPQFEFVRNELHISQVAKRTRGLYEKLLAKSNSA